MSGSTDKTQARDKNLLDELDSITAESTLDDLAALIDKINEMKGWNTQDRTEGDWAALAHSEISEAFESFRNNERKIWVGAKGKPEGMAIEYADAIIRILHWFHTHNVSVEDCLRRKIAYNIGREYLHGGKAI